MVIYCRICMDEVSLDKGNSWRMVLFCRVKEFRRVLRWVVRLGEVEEELSMFCINMCFLLVSLLVIGDFWLVVWGFFI